MTPPLPLRAPHRAAAFALVALAACRSSATAEPVGEESPLEGVVAAPPGATGVRLGPPPTTMNTPFGSEDLGPLDPGSPHGVPHEPEPPLDPDPFEETDPLEEDEGIPPVDPFTPPPAQPPPHAPPDGIDL